MFLEVINVVIIASFLSATICYLASLANPKENSSKREIANLFGDIGYVLLLSTMIGRALAFEYLPLYSFYETLLLVALILTTIAKLADRLYHVELLKFFGFPLAAVFIGISFFASQDPIGLLSAMKSSWLGAHISFVLIGYGFFSAACITGGMYLLLDKYLKEKRNNVLFDMLPSLQRLDIINHRLVSVGFILLTLGIIMGGIWSQEIWGKFWFWEMKFLLTLFTWLVYAFYLYKRLMFGLQGKLITYLNILGFIMVLLNYFVPRFININGFHQFY